MRLDRPCHGVQIAALSQSSDAMNLDVKIPAVGESITSGLLSTWHKNDGDAVAVGDILLTLETDKVSTGCRLKKRDARIKVPAGSR
jgi:2-oxoglutarate dehydrogenase E2 component (dihydrolipoamide succinyltransferase)